MWIKYADLIVNMWSLKWHFEVMEMAAEQHLTDQLIAVSTTPTPPYNYSWFSVATTADLNAFYFYEVCLAWFLTLNWIIYRASAWKWDCMFIYGNCIRRRSILKGFQPKHDFNLANHVEILVDVDYLLSA